jgi:hypothetical protein
MSKEEIKSHLALSRRRYAVMATKKAKGRILDQYCEVSGATRKHAIKTLSTRKRPARRRGCPSGGTSAGKALLAKLWRISDMLCGKLLKAVIGLYIDSLLRAERHPPEVCAEVLSMSASTIDRRLKSVKAGCDPDKRRRQSSLAEHRNAIPLKVEAWPDSYPREPGWTEADTVAHCGGSMAGSFIWSVTLTDVATAWTRVRCVWNKGAEGVKDCVSGYIRAVPFIVLAFNSDNGGEFINAHLIRYFAEYVLDVKQTRSRAYRKNDNAHVEQKNGAQVRNLLGYGRMDDESLMPLINRIYEKQDLIKNLFTPTLRLLNKIRVGAKYKKTYETPPKTPAQRVLESPAVSGSHKAQVRRMLAENDILTLKRAIDKDLAELAKRLASRAGAAPSGATSSARPSHPSDALGPRASSAGTRGRAAALPLKPPPALKTSTFGVVFI